MVMVAAKNTIFFPEYIKRYKDEFAGIKPIPVVLDCGNGAAGCVARTLFESVGLKPKYYLNSPMGHFPIITQTLR